jgi:hypothetical protein
MRSTRRIGRAQELESARTSGSCLILEKPRDQSRRNSGVSGSAKLRALVEGLAREDQRIEKPFREWQAVCALRDRGRASDLLRRGCPELQEPDFVLGPPSGPILAGIEITELESKGARARNVEIRKLQNERFARPTKRSRNMAAVNDAERTFAEAGGAGSEYQRLQKFLPEYNERELAQAITTRIGDKRTKAYRERASYPIHLILDRRDCIFEGYARQSTRRAEHSPGRFAAIWCVHSIHGVWQI